MGISKSRKKNLRWNHCQMMSLLETWDLKVFSHPPTQGRVIQWEKKTVCSQILQPLNTYLKIFHRKYRNHHPWWSGTIGAWYRSRVVIMSSTGFRIILYSAGSGWGGCNNFLFIWLCCCDIRGDEGSQGGTSEGCNCLRRNNCGYVLCPLPTAMSWSSRHAV